jgi:hypothetical protein
VIWPAAVERWGTSAAERAQEFACDELIARPDHTMWRAVDVDAPAAITFRWLCQLRAAPYSYDKLDNLGRRSPQTLTPGLERLEVGQRVQTVFRLVAFEPGRSLTMRSRSRLMGHVVCTYRVDERPAERSRIVVKLLVDHGSWAPQRALMRLLLPPGDLVMMRRQLLNLRGLAERPG